MTFQRILVTGATGMLGRHVVPVLERRFADRAIMAVGSEAGDLSRLDVAVELIRKTRPDCIVHLAAYGAGEAFNRAWPADCMFQNAAMALNLYEAAGQNGVKKVVYPVSFDAYPSQALAPVTEAQLWSGYNRIDYGGHALGKRIGAAVADAYRYQHGLESSVMVLGELYGEYANFRPDEMSSVAEIVKRMTDAERLGAPTVNLPASPDERRDLVYAGDVAELVPWFIENVAQRPVNVSQGVGYTALEVAGAVREAAGYRVEAKLTGAPNDAIAPHVLNVDALVGLGLDCPTPLKTGVKRMVQWYFENLNAPRPGFRA